MVVLEEYICILVYGFQTGPRMAYKWGNLSMLFTSWEVGIVKNSDLDLETADQGCIFLKPANNISFFFCSKCAIKITKLMGLFTQLLPLNWFVKNLGNNRVTRVIDKERFSWSNSKI